MGETLETPLVYCTGAGVAKTPKYRPDPQGQGVWIYCKGHHREELETWEKLGLTIAIAEVFILKMKASQVK